MIYVAPNIFLEERELSFTFVKASGPGGQNVNKVSTAAQLRFDINKSSLNGYIKSKLKDLAKNRINSEGVLLIDSKSFRTQEKNKKEAIERLKQLILKASFKPKFRVKTKPTKNSQKRRVDNKKMKSQKKQNRSFNASRDD